VERPIDIRRTVNENQVWGSGHGIGQRGGRSIITDRGADSGRASGWVPEQRGMNAAGRPEGMRVGAGAETHARVGCAAVNARGTGAL